MRKLVIFLTLPSLVFAQPVAAASPSIGEVRNFGPDLSGSCSFPEGVAVDSRGNVYASSLNAAAASGPANICVLDRRGTLIDTIAVKGTGANAFNTPASLVFRGRTVYVANLALFQGGPQQLSVFTAPYPGAP